MARRARPHVGRGGQVGVDGDGAARKARRARAGWGGVASKGVAVGGLAYRYAAFVLGRPVHGPTPRAVLCRPSGSSSGPALPFVSCCAL